MSERAFRSDEPKVATADGGGCRKIVGAKDEGASSAASIVARGSEPMEELA